MRITCGERLRAQSAGQRSLQRCQQGERSESIPLSPPQSVSGLFKNRSVVFLIRPIINLLIYYGVSTLMRHSPVSHFLQRGNNNLDLIRISCAFFVIYSHSFALSPAAGSTDILFKMTSLGYVAFGGVAVKTFFLISGLLVTNSLISNGNIIHYVASRIFRVYPAYLAVIVTFALLIGPWLSSVSIGEYFSSKETLHYIVRTLKFNVQYTLPGVFTHNALTAVNGSLWTIPMEVKAYFYLLLIYLVSLVFGPYKKAFIALVSLAIIIEPFTPFKGALISKSDDPSIYLLYPFFSIGCLLAIFKDKIKTTSFFAVTVIALLLFFLVNNDQLKTGLFYLFSSFLLLYISSLSLINKIKIKNDISYGIYLWAFPIQQTIASFVIASPYINILLSAVLSSLFAYVSFRLIEGPSMQFGKRLTNRK